MLVAHGEVCGAVRRQTCDGEWRTNISCGSRRITETVEPRAARLALEAVEMTCLELAVVDIMPTPHGGFCVLEVNAAPDFGADYVSDRNVFDAVIERLELAAEAGTRLTALDAA